MGHASPLRLRIWWFWQPEAQTQRERAAYPLAVQGMMSDLPRAWKSP